MMRPEEEEFNCEEIDKEGFAKEGLAETLMCCPGLLLTTSSLAGTPSPGPRRLTKAPAASHPRPQGGEGE